MAVESIKARTRNTNLMKLLPRVLLMAVAGLLNSRGIFAALSQDQEYDYLGEFAFTFTRFHYDIHNMIV